MLRGKKNKPNRIMNTKEPVKLRRRTTRTGLTSLYLDIYVHGRRACEYLRLYLVPEKTREDRRKNAETLRLAEAVRARRVVEIQNGRFGFGGGRGAVRFFDYFAAQAERQGRSSRTACLWRTVLENVRMYERDKGITFVDITRRWLDRYKDFLRRSGLSAK